MARDRIEFITSVERRRRWSAAAKVAMVAETHQPGVMARLVARRHGGAALRRTG
jgi:transposase